MSNSRAMIALLTALSLAASVQVRAASLGSPDAPEKTAPQGEDPPGADNGVQSLPPAAENKGVIVPPPTGDAGIHTQVPDPNAGTPEDVIPPPTLQGEPR